MPKYQMDITMNNLPQRKSPRLQDYDYSQSGGYFITIVTYGREHLFGNIENDQMMLSVAGHVTELCWTSIPHHYTDVCLGDFVVMPNHIHGILYLLGEDSSFKTLIGRVINAYKGAVTARIRKLNQTKQIVWQSRYYDHIIRDDIDELRIRTYIQNNIGKWADDSLCAEL
jgi:putative transposase